MINVIAKIPGIAVPAWFTDAVVRGGPSAGVALLEHTARQLSEIAAGIHLLPMGSTDVVRQLVLAVRRDAGSLPRTGEEV